MKNEGLEEPVWIQVQALLNFGEENLTWNRTIQICPPEAPDTAMMVRMLQYQLQECQAGYEETVQLPAEVSEQAVYLVSTERYSLAVDQLSSQEQPYVDYGQERSGRMETETTEI